MDSMRRRQTRRFQLRVPFWFQLPKSAETLRRWVESSNISDPGLFLVTELIFEIGTPANMSPWMPETEARKQSREWFPRGRVARTRLDKLPVNKTGIGVELQHFDVLRTGGSDIFSQPTDADVNPEVR
jgi:hypothetical protein